MCQLLEQLSLPTSSWELVLELFSSGEEREQDDGERYRPQEISMDREELDREELDREDLDREELDREELVREELDREVLTREALLANECPRRISSQRFG